MRSLSSNTKKGLLLAATLLCAWPVSGALAAADAFPSWDPVSSETLVRLPASSLEKRLQADFADSTLGQAVVDMEQEIGFKTQTLQDLQQAIARAEGELRNDLRHQFLEEKRSFLQLMSQHGALRRRQVETKLRVFEDLHDQLARDQAAQDSPAVKELIQRQDSARARFQSSLGEVDSAIYQSAAIPESRYAAKYAENMAAIEQLVEAINSHAMNPSAISDGAALTKQDYVRKLIADAQADLAILDQETTILGYMAKLVAFDALALSEEALDAELADSDTPGDLGPATAVGFFVR